MIHSLTRPIALALSVMLLAVAPSSNPNAPYETAQRLVDVGSGRRLNIYCSGAGSPTVVLDGAIGSSMFVWHTVQPALAQHARVCSYDRAGYGFSDPGGPPHTTNENVNDLHALLKNARIKPPYLLVAHSLNAFDARVFADRYRSEVAGLVLIDPSETGEDRISAIYGTKKVDAEMAANEKFLRACDRKANLHQLRSGDDCVGPPDRTLPARLNEVLQHHTTSAAMWDAVLSEEAKLRTDLGEVKDQQIEYGNLPLVVLTAGAAEDAAKQTGATVAQIAAATQLSKRLHDADAAFSNRGVNCVIPGASHYIQIEKPGVVIRAVLEVIGSSKGSRKPSCTRII